MSVIISCVIEESTELCVVDKEHVHALMEITAVPVSNRQSEDVSTRVQLVNVAMTIVLTQWTLFMT